MYIVLLLIFLTKQYISEIIPYKTEFCLCVEMYSDLFNQLPITGHLDRFQSFIKQGCN